MAARDIISDGAFQWQYCDMDLHRKDVMLKILNWGSAWSIGAVVWKQTSSYSVLVLFLLGSQSIYGLLLSDDKT